MYNHGKFLYFCLVITFFITIILSILNLNTCRYKNKKIFDKKLCEKVKIIKENDIKEENKYKEREKIIELENEKLIELEINKKYNEIKYK